MQGGTGEPGPQGLAGFAGLNGPPGKDGEKAKRGDCTGTSTSQGESVCCGVSTVDWHNYYNSGSFLDIDTSSCRFDNTPLYFTSIIGNAYIHNVMGASSIYDPSANHFRVYLSDEINHRTPDSGVANAFRFRIKWCGAGKSSGPKVPNVCCGTDSPSWGSAWHTGWHTVDAKACEMKGDPVWITAVQGAQTMGTDTYVGYDGGYGQTYRYSTMYIHKAYASSDYHGYVSSSIFNRGGKDEMLSKYCLFGEPFPTGNMRVNLEETAPDEYPCEGIRVMDDGVVQSDQAVICCGKSEPAKWRSKGSFEIYQDIDTSKCNFINSNSNTVVYLTSVGGAGGHWQVSGTTAYMTSSATSFSMSLGVHPAQKQAFYANDPGQGWFVNWCGIGKARAAPTLPVLPPAPPPPPNVLVTPVTVLSVPPAGANILSGAKSILNEKCAGYRDERDQFSYTKQKTQYAQCMAADCVQSLESSNNAAKPWENPGCRFRDALGFCYAYGSAQKWCSENPTNSYCNDGGKSFAASPLGSAAAGKSTWMPNQNIAERSKGADVAGSAFSCQCIKDCSCSSSKCWCSDVSTRPVGKGDTDSNAQFDKRLKNPPSSGSKTGMCFCICGNEAQA